MEFYSRETIECNRMIDVVVCLLICYVTKLYAYDDM